MRCVCCMCRCCRVCGDSRTPSMRHRTTVANGYGKNWFALPVYIISSLIALALVHVVLSNY